MGSNRRFHGAKVERLIVSVPTTTVDRIREHIKRLPWGHPQRDNISEFVRVAITEKLART